MKRIFIALILLLFIAPVFAKDPNPEAVKYYNSGIDQYNNFNYEEAITSFNKATQIDSTFYNAFYNLAHVYMSLNKNTEAIPVLKKAIALKSDDYESLYNLGKIYYYKGYSKDALDYLDRVPYFSQYYADSQKMVEKAEANIAAISKSINKQVVKPAQTKVEPVVASPVAISTPVVIIKDAVYANIGTPSGVAVDNNENLYIANFNENVIYKITKDNVKTIAAAQNALLGPIGLDVDEAGNIYAANYSKNNVVKITPQGVVSTILNVKKPYYLKVQNGWLWVSEQDTNTVIKHKL